MKNSRLSMGMAIIVGSLISPAAIAKERVCKIEVIRGEVRRTISSAKQMTETWEECYRNAVALAEQEPLATHYFCSRRNNSEQDREFTGDCFLPVASRNAWITLIHVVEWSYSDSWIPLQRSSGAVTKFTSKFDPHPSKGTRLYAEGGSPIRRRAFLGLAPCTRSDRFAMHLVYDVELGRYKEVQPRIPSQCDTATE